MTTTWPWWMGAMALAGVTVGYWLLDRRVLGVSGIMTRALNRSTTTAGEQALLSDPSALEAAMLAATRAEFGESAGLPSSPDLQDACDASSIKAPLSRPQAALFLGSLMMGGLLSSLLRGGVSVRFALPEVFERSVGGGAAGFAVMFLGGILVGFGTRMSGGCTSGHGLTGCSRLQPGSLVSTVVFLGTAIVISLLLAGRVA